MTCLPNDIICCLDLGDIAKTEPSLARWLAKHVEPFESYSLKYLYSMSIAWVTSRIAEWIAMTLDVSLTRTLSVGTDSIHSQEVEDCTLYNPHLSLRFLDISPPGFVASVSSLNQTLSDKAFLHCSQFLASINQNTNRLGAWPVA